MAVNKYFSGGKGMGSANEQKLVEDIIVESIQVRGMDMYYIPRSAVEFDKLMHQEPTSAFKNHYVIEMYIDDVNDFGGEGGLLSKFGWDTVESATFFTTIRRFREVVGDIRPEAGDLIYFPITRRLFEVKDVDTEDPFFQLSKKFVFKFSCSLYVHSYEDFDTGIDKVDDVYDRENFNDLFDSSDDIQQEADEHLEFDPENPFGGEFIKDENKE